MIPAANPPLVTVAVATIGRTEYLRHTLDSLQAQTYPHTEVIILDNDSPRETQELLAAFSASHGNARVLRSDERLPMDVNFQRGVAAAAGAFVVFFHDDDIYVPRFIERQAQFLQAHGPVGFVGSNSLMINGQGQVLRARSIVKHTTVVAGGAYIRAVLTAGRSPIGTPCIMYRKTFLDRFGFGEVLRRHNGDLVTLMRMAEHGDVGMIADVLWRTRVHAGSFTASVPPGPALTTGRDVFLAYCDEYARRHPTQAVEFQAIKRVIVRRHPYLLAGAWLRSSESESAQSVVAALREQGFAGLALACSLMDRTGVGQILRRVLSGGERIWVRASDG